ncbi:hypothetical protein [Caulobacter sp. LARHSG274]
MSGETPRNGLQIGAGQISFGADQFSTMKKSTVSVSPQMEQVPVPWIEMRLCSE